MKIVKKKWWFSLIEIMIAITIVAILSTITFSYISKSQDREAFNNFKLVLAWSLEKISEEAKNWVTTQNLAKFWKSADTDFVNLYDENVNQHWKSDALSRFSPLNQTAYYYWVYFNLWKTFLRTVQYEQEWCSERRKALKNKWVSWTDFWNLDLSNTEMNLDLTSLIETEDNYSFNENSERNKSTKTLEVKEAELLDSWSCYISSEKKFFWTNRPIWLTWIDFWDWRWMIEKNLKEWFVILVDANNPYWYKLFNKETKVNSIRNSFSYENIEELNQRQQKFLLKNYWVDNIQSTWELKKVKLQFSIHENNSNKCQDWDFVDFSTRANAWNTYNNNFSKWLICLSLDKNALSELWRSK